MVVGNDGDPPLLLHNDGPSENHFVSFKLIGHQSNRDAMGARVKVRTGQLTQTRVVAGGGSYLSQSDLRTHFGLGQSTRVDQVEIWWPSGLRQVFRHVQADKFYLVEEGKDRLPEQKFSPRRM